MPVSSSVERLHVRSETPDSRESGRPKWKFVTYHLQETPEGRYVVEDETAVLDGVTGEYRNNIRNTAINLTENLTSKLQGNEVSADEVVAQCNAVRAKLDEKGVKVFFDGKNGKLYPKWKYLVGEGVRSEAITDVPAEIMTLVRTNPDYFKTPEYKNWFGPRMQNKREQVISDVLAESYPDKVNKETGGEMVQTQAAEHTRLRDAYQLAAAGLADKLARRFELPAQIKEYVDEVVGFGDILFKVQRGNMHENELKGIVRDVMKRRFAEDEEALQKIDAVLPQPKEVPFAESPAPVKAAPQAEPEVSLPEQNEAITDDEHAFFKEVSETVTEYHELAAGVADVEGMDRFVQQLAKEASQGSPARQKGIRQVLVAIDQGAFGEVSEQRLTGLVRNEAEKAFFAERPELNLRNVRKGDDRTLFAHIDAFAPTDGVQRIIKRLLEGCLSDADAENPQKVGKIASFMTTVLTGNDPRHEAMRAALTRTVIEYNDADHQLVFKDIEKLRAEMADLGHQVK